MTITTFDEMDVRRRLIAECNRHGSPEAFARAFGFEELYIKEATKGDAALSARLLRVLGFELAAKRYVEVAR